MNVIRCGAMCCPETRKNNDNAEVWICAYHWRFVKNSQKAILRKYSKQRNRVMWYRNYERILAKILRDEAGLHD